MKYVVIENMYVGETEGVVVIDSGRSTGVLLYNNHLIGRTSTCGSRGYVCLVNVTTGGEPSTLHCGPPAAPRECQQRFDASETSVHLTPGGAHG